MTEARSEKLKKKVFWPQWIAGCGGINQSPINFSKCILRSNINNVAVAAKHPDKRRIIILNFSYSLVVDNGTGISGRMVVSVHQLLNFCRIYISGDTIGNIVGGVVIQSGKIFRCYRRRYMRQLRRQQDNNYDQHCAHLAWLAVHHLG